MSEQPQGSKRLKQVGIAEYFNTKKKKAKRSDCVLGSTSLVTCAHAPSSLKKRKLAFQSKWVFGKHTHEAD
eukprot:CAMPEP_0198244774 /NCGR_PEP_ID=MMETSP1446-20131203/37402_1 /TAXON_ID=1461542 ORGANISM="Unidentified sp, Strain CCMP2111" /NCGR_SAMPLE_ID=MMETSP1446 /ASSEMBLY_ACC=CAM_ASM_001112 /LENGTH=70 /DNA_ID=CAMNT_0043928871 /DNA_START=128 /DNA_END=337 /DNA_ORIENTATION=+